MPSLLNFELALREAAPPYLVGVIHAETNEVPCPLLFDWDGDRAEYMQGYEDTREAIEKQMAAKPKRILTDAQIEAEADDLEEDIMDRLFHMRGEW